MYSVDALRGLVMALMALDHVRDYFSNAYFFEPTDLTQTNAALFFTRWITHLCAPVFVFLAGTGAFLSASRGKTKKGLAGFLLTRGLWLVFLDLFAVHTLGWWFNFDYHLLYGDVLWALGWCMVAMAGLIFLPVWSIAAIGIAMVALHNIFDAVSADSFGTFRWLWAVLHTGDMLEPLPGVHFVPGYPLVPWIGVMAAGYGFGALMLRPQEKRRKELLTLGFGLTLAFLALRATKLYGDPHAWSVQKNGLFTFLSFINCEKYPPSLLYLLMTLGPAIATLALFERAPNLLRRPLVTLGRVPLFYYLLHLTLIHALAVAVALAKYGQAPWMFKLPPLPVSSAILAFPAGYGYGLAALYAIWLGVVLALYPACRRFAGVKERRREVWLSYL
ncbi:MAG TPA: heparan-alpha-glucosaminide N-acetyltransferase domain-containing protein [Terriglobales bacterium]|nr:heparan-alpha-glucosaminide N-acetyltransferase domain-containing protein [Terriglobales bacterium]